MPGDGSTSAALPIGNQRDAHHAATTPIRAPNAATDTGPMATANSVWVGARPNARSTSRFANDAAQYREIATPTSTMAATRATNDTKSNTLASNAVTARV